MGIKGLAKLLSDEAPDVSLFRLLFDPTLVFRTAVVHAIYYAWCCLLSSHTVSPPTSFTHLLLIVYHLLVYS